MNEVGDAVNQQSSDFQPVSESLPNTKYKIQIVFGPHQTAKQADFLTEPLRNCDVFIPEFGLWTEESLGMWNKVADGKLLPREFTAKCSDDNFKPYQERVLELLHKSGIKVALIDIPKGHALEEEIEELDRKYNNLSVDLPSFDEVLDAQKEYVRLEADWIRRREDYMISQLPRVLEKIISENPEMDLSEQVRVLLSLGLTHTRVLHKLRKLGYAVARPIFPTIQEIFGYNGEAKRAVIFNKPLDGLVLARSLIETLIIDQVGNRYGGSFRFLTDDATKIFLWMRKMLSSFTYEDCKTLWQQRNGFHGIYLPFLDMLQKKGLSFPKNESELDALLAEKTSK